MVQSWKFKEWISSGVFSAHYDATYLSPSYMLKVYSRNTFQTGSVWSPIAVGFGKGQHVLSLFIHSRLCVMGIFLSGSLGFWQSLWILSFKEKKKECRLRHFRSHDFMMNSWDNNSDWIWENYLSREITPRGKTEKSHCFSQTGLDQTQAGSGTGRPSQSAWAPHNTTCLSVSHFRVCDSCGNFSIHKKCPFSVPSKALMK